MLKIRTIVLSLLFIQIAIKKKKQSKSNVNNGPKQK